MSRAIPQEYLDRAKQSKVVVQGRGRTDIFQDAQKNVAAYGR
jgi:hypothetical protein